MPPPPPPKKKKKKKKKKNWEFMFLLCALQWVFFLHVLDISDREETAPREGGPYQERRSLYVNDRYFPLVFCICISNVLGYVLKDLRITFVGSLKFNQYIDQSVQVWYTHRGPTCIPVAIGA